MTHETLPPTTTPLDIDDLIPFRLPLVNGLPATALSLERLARLFKFSETIELHETDESYCLLEHDDRLEEFLAKGFLPEYADDGSSEPDPDPVILWHEAPGGYADPKYYIKLSALKGALERAGVVHLCDGRSLACETMVSSMLDAIDAAVLEERFRLRND